MIRDAVRKLQMYEGRLSSMKKDAVAASAAAVSARESARVSGWAHDLLSKLADRKREEVRVRVERIVLAALRSVFGSSIGFRFDVSILRGVVAIRPEIGFTQKGGTMAYVGVDQVAGGVVDVVSLALRVAVLLSRRPALRPVLIADEPLKHLSDEYLPAAAEMLRRLADECGLQMLIVSHEPDVSLRAHRVFRVSRDSSGSRVTAEDQ